MITKPTWTLGALGALLVVLGHDKLGGLIWTLLGAGSVGVALQRSGSSIFPAWFVCAQQEKKYLAQHLPFLFGGIWLILND
jgi:hypothetical protein